MQMTIDITKLSTDELEKLRTLFYSIGEMAKVADINKQIAWLNGWTNEKPF